MQAEAQAERVLSKQVLFRSPKRTTPDERRSSDERASSDDCAVPTGGDDARSAKRGPRLVKRVLVRDARNTFRGQSYALNGHRANVRRARL